MSVVEMGCGEAGNQTPFLDIQLFVWFIFQTYPTFKNKKLVYIVETKNQKF